MAQIAWYPLNDFDIAGDPAVDLSGNGYTGTYIGTWNYREAGPVAGAANVTSVRATAGALVDIDVVAPHVSNEGTLMIWVKLPSGATWGNGGAANGEGGIAYILNTAGTYDVALVFGGLTNNEVSATANQVSASYTPTLNNDWHHFAVTWKAGDTTKLYQDGTLVASSAGNGTGIAPFNAAGIGDTSLTGFTFIGNLSQVKLYDEALSATQITTESNKFLPLIPGVRTKCKEIPPVDLLKMWDDVELTLSETCDIYAVLSPANVEKIFENVPCSLELTGTRQELDSSDNYITIQNWIVTISGKRTLPLAANYGSLRFITESGLTIDSYTYYQSPCDIAVAIEGELQ